MCRYRVKDVESQHLADVWTLWKDKEEPLGIERTAAYNAVAVISQVSYHLPGCRCSADAQHM